MGPKRIKIIRSHVGLWEAFMKLGTYWGRLGSFLPQILESANA